MSSTNPTAPSAAPAQRPIYLNPVELGLKMPAAGIVSLLHRVSGVILFLSIPVAIFMLDISLRNEAAFTDVVRFLSFPLVKLCSLVVFWALAHHLCAGIRFLLLDVHLGLHKPYPQYSAYATFAVSLLFTLFVGVKLW